MPFRDCFLFMDSWVPYEKIRILIASSANENVQKINKESRNPGIFRSCFLIHGLLVSL